MSDLPEDQILVKSNQEMLTKLARLYNSCSFGPPLIDAVEQVVYDHRARFKSTHGVAFPPMRPFVLPSLKLIIVYRTDLTNAEIRAKLVQLARDIGSRGIKVEATEFAAAVVRCWPGYKPPLEELRDPKLHSRVLT